MTQDRKQTDRILFLLTVLLLVITACVLLYNNYLAHFTSDDYLYSFKFNPGFVNEPPYQVEYKRIESPADYLESLVLLYKNLTGRLVPHGMLQLVLLFPAWFFDVVNLAFFLLLTWLMTNWLGTKSVQLKIQYWLLVLILFYLAIAKTIPVVYYPAFSCNYIWTQLIVFSLLWVIRTITETKQSGGNGILALGGMFIFGMLAGDTNEPLVPGILLALGCWGIYALISKKKLPAIYYAAFAGLFAGFLFLFFAPGNQNRAVYEAQSRVVSSGIRINPANAKLLIFSMIGAIPALLIAMLGVLNKPGFKDNDLFPCFILVTVLIGEFIALMVSPIYMHRMNVLFVGFLILACVYLLSVSRLSKSSVVFVITLIMLPAFGFKVYSDCLRLTKAKHELNAFEKKVTSAPGDSVSVNPRVYMDAVTKANWAKPVASYYNKSTIRIVDKLDDKYYQSSMKADYVTDSQAADKRISLESVRFTNLDQHTRIIYLLIAADTVAISANTLSVSLYSKDIRMKYAEDLFSSLPLRLRKLLMYEQPWFQPPEYQMKNGKQILATVFRNDKNHYDYLRLRITSGERRINDIVLRNVEFSQ